MKVVNRRKKEEADKRFGDLLRKQVNDHLKAASDTADSDTLFAKLEDATVRVFVCAKSRWHCSPCVCVSS